MELNEPLIRVGPPSHPLSIKKENPFYLRLLARITLIVLISFLTIHLPDVNLRPQSREQTIQEIAEILEKYSKDLDKTVRIELAQTIYEESVRYNHDPKFILALIAIESSFQNKSVSERGAMGLMQLMPYVAKAVAIDLGIEWNGDFTLFNPFVNIRIGIHYLSQLIIDFEDLRIALVAYNYGPTYVKSLIERRQRIPIHYYRKILTAYQTL